MSAPTETTATVTGWRLRNSRRQLIRAHTTASIQRGTATNQVVEPRISRSRISTAAAATAMATSPGVRRHGGSAVFVCITCLLGPRAISVRG